MNARTRTFLSLDRLGITHGDAKTLVRCSATLHTWHEHECNGVIQRDEQTNVPYWYSDYSGKRLDRTTDRETGAIRRAKTIAAQYGLTAYIQGDPRGCALYLVRPQDAVPGVDIDGYYSRGIAVCP